MMVPRFPGAITVGRNFAFLGFWILSTAASPTLSPQGEKRQIDGRPPEWEYRGCYSDNASSRTLQAASFTSDNMTRSLCKSFCDIGQYALSGTEYGRECYCDFVYHTELLFSGGCDQPCAGISNETCGAQNQLDVYRNINAFLPKVKPLVVGWEFKGCYFDPVNPRTLPYLGHIQGGVTIEKCITACKAEGHTIAGLEYSTECWCGDFLLGFTHQLPANQCLLTCEGDHQEFCGGTGALGLYAP